MRCRLPLLLIGVLLTPAAAAAASVRDACALLTAQDLQSIAGGKLKEAKPSRQSDGVLAVSQCFYSLDPFVHSVSLPVTRADAAASASGIQSRWDRLFHSATGAGREEEEREAAGGKEKASPVRAIPGIGQEAFWEANAVGGALYVLQKNVFFRVSIGGAEGETAKVETTKKLARQILRRL